MALNIVVRSPNWLGDHVMALPFYRALRAAYGNSALCLLRPESMEGLDFPEIFTKTMTFPPSERRGLSGARALSRRLRTEHFDLSFSLAASFSSGLPFFLARIPCRLGFDRSGSSILLTDYLVWSQNLSGKHKSQLYLELLAYACGHPTHLPKSELKSPSPREPMIVVAPGASISLRQWPYQSEFLPKLRARYPHLRIVVVGTSAEKVWSEVIATLDDATIEDKIGKTSLPELIQLCHRASLIISNDSGVAHIAGTLSEAPTLVVFGPGDPAYIAPLGPRVYGLRLESLPCSPCEKSYCKAIYGYQACLKGISAETLLERVISILG